MYFDYITCSSKDEKNKKPRGCLLDKILNDRRKTLKMRNVICLAREMSSII